MRRYARAAAAILLAGGVFTRCRDTQAPRQGGKPEASATPLPTVTLVGAGTVASCSLSGDEATAAILDTIAGTVFTTGDNVYPSGSLANYQNCYNPSWGRHKARTRPALGNHEYDTSPTAADYFTYFGTAAGDPTKGYYSYDLGAWHIVVLNSQVSMSAGSPQEQWLRADLAADPQHCTLAYMHYERFSSGTTHGSMVGTQPLWQALYDFHADIVLAGHEHNYERFAPQTPSGVADPVNGIREFVVGTGGGAGAYPFGTPIANSEVRITGVNGVLQLTLSDGTYAWKFIAVAGQTATDAGSGTCHGSAAPPPTPSVNAGPDLTTHPGDTLKLTSTFSDAGTNDAPWTYTITWGDGSSSTGTTSSQSPITASHVYSVFGLDSVRVTVTNSQARSGSDSLSVQVISSSSVVLVGAGDIADCTKNGDSLTANLLDTIAGTVFVAGDNAYPSGSSTDYTNCYDPTWGRHKARTRPVPGNHEYSTSGASGYFGYFGAAAGDPSKGYYSYDLGDWHIVALNSNIDKAAGSPQEQWLRADLAASTKRCTLAYMHHPLFSSGTLADTTTFTLWQDLYAAGAEIVVAGHDHNYQRFAPQTPNGVADQANGIREFVAGMGGAGTFTLGPPLPNTEVQNDQTLGVLKLTLYTTGYDWKFIPVAGKTFTDAGSATCHDAPSAGNHVPTALAGGPYSGVEGAAVAFDGSASSDPDGDALTYAWSFGDGSTGTGIKPSHSYADNGSYTVTLTVTDARGAVSAAATTTATITNVAPAVNAGGNQTATAGSPFTLSASFSDPGVNDAPWSYSINWGDGSPQTTGSTTSQANPITATHTYAAAGTDNAQVSVTDKDGGTGSATVTVTVAATVNHPPTAAPGGPYTGTEGALVTLDGSGSSDPDGDALTYAWSFGDGSAGTGVRPSHGYADNGGYTVTLTVTDARGAASSAVTTTATITNAPPVVTAGATQTATAGTAFTFSASFSDAGVNDAPWSYSINWGDGSPQTTGSTTSQANPVTATHTYAAAGTDTVRVTVTDKDGGVGAGKAVVTVAAVNHPPTAAAGGPYVGFEGTPVSFDGSGSSDPDGDALTYAWSFGDGSSGTGVRPTHAYANNGNYTVTLTVTDARGAASSPVTTTATVANMPPSVNAGANQTATAGSPVTLSASFSDPGVNDAPWSYSINWGDGTSLTTGSTTSQTNPITAIHTYSAAGSYAVQVTVTDRDGGAGSASKSVTVSAATTVTLVGAGTVASCSSSGDEATAAILDTIAGTVFTAGDNVYPSGSLANYQNCYNPSWGRHKARTRPALGNHEYDTSPTAADYFTYFGTAAGDPTKGYYSYDLGAWHIVVLNSQVSMSTGSPQEQWLRADLAAHPTRCTLAYWHYPRFSSGTTHGSMVGTQPLWQALYDYGADLVLAGHEHNYERFAPQTPTGVADGVNGIREFVVGTGGGAGGYPFGTPIANSEVRITGVNGVLQLTLSDGTYAWKFIAVAGQTATDSGSGSCH